MIPLDKPLVIVLSPIGTIIGRFVTREPIMLSEPRLIVTQREKVGVRVMLEKILGEPTEITILQPGGYYVVAEKGLEDTYREATTGLTIAKVLPPRMN